MIIATTNACVQKAITIKWFHQSCIVREYLRLAMRKAKWHVIIVSANPHARAKIVRKAKLLFTNGLEMLERSTRKLLCSK